MTIQYRYIPPGSRIYIRSPWGLYRQEPCRRPQLNRYTASTYSQGLRVDVTREETQTWVQTVSADSRLSLLNDHLGGQSGAADVFSPAFLAIIRGTLGTADPRRATASGPPPASRS
jgi:hypothetical protein